ncbi:hypothetical protein [Streptomyces kronopolitis]|uniref:hypothetical protein n=1 Tax=Streptomyces kronopolitis TaxID=1612435 RepID=UPI0020BDE311|nr:hypothetical protein [Streptomyces kronopolitis]MCL6298709.1 hypothetical protein [Streptomyces kronopolitis]
MPTQAATWASGTPLLSRAGRQVWRVVHTLADGRAVLVLIKDHLAGLAPDPAEPRTSEQPALLPENEQMAGLQAVTLNQTAQDRDERWVHGHGPGVTQSSPLEVTGLMNSSAIGPATAHLGLGGVEQALSPPGSRQRRGIDPQGDGFLRPQTRVIEGCEERGRRP